MKNYHLIKEWPVIDAFKLVQAFESAYPTEVLTQWLGTKKDPILQVKIDVNGNIGLQRDLELLKSNIKLWKNLDVYTNKRGAIIFEIKPLEYGYLDIKPFMKKHKIKNRQGVYNHKDKFERLMITAKLIFYKFK